MAETTTAAIPLPILGVALGVHQLAIVRFGFPIAAFLLWRSGWKKTALGLASYSVAVAWAPIAGIDPLGVAEAGAPVVQA